MAQVLVVEDDATMRQLLDVLLRRDGHDVTLAADGSEGRRLLKQSVFELVITDLIMPEVEGLQLLREIRRLDSPPKTIAMSGGGRGSANDYLELARLLGASATLSKPFTQRELRDTIARVLGAEPVADEPLPA